MASPERASFIEKWKLADLIDGKPDVRSFTPVGGFAARK
jgi:hypothetical protein